MKMLLVFVCMILSGCIKSVRPGQVVYDLSDLRTLKNECGKIETEGSILSLLQEIKINHFEILYLLGLPDPTKEELRITELAASTKNSYEKLSKLVNPEWSVSKWNQTVTWTLSENNFRPSFGTYIPNGFSIKDATVIKVFMMGKESDSLKTKFTLTLEGKSLKIEFKNLGSSIDICQLQRTLTIILEVKFRDIKRIKKQYFNLSVENNL